MDIKTDQSIDTTFIAIVRTRVRFRVLLSFSSKSQSHYTATLERSFLSMIYKKKKEISHCINHSPKFILSQTIRKV